MSAKREKDREIHTVMDIACRAHSLPSSFLSTPTRHLINDSVSSSYTQSLTLAGGHDAEGALWLEGTGEHAYGVAHQLARAVARVPGEDLGELKTEMTREVMRVMMRALHQPPFSCLFTQSQRQTVT
jgi:hypothetical protein